MSIDLQQLLDDAAKRAAGAAAGGGAGRSLGQLFKVGAVGEQLAVWGVLQSVLQAVLEPELTFLTRGVNELMQATPLSPADLANMVVRHIVTQQQGSDYAKQSGVAPSDFQRLVQSAGEGLSPGDLAEALRRELIPEGGAGADAVSFEQGIAESHIRDKWAPIVRKLAVQEPTPADVLDAALEGQLPLEQAQQLYQRFGGDPEHYDWLFRTRGSAPTPLELSEMAQRGIIPWDGDDPTDANFHQGFLQGPWRNQWEEPYRKLAVYVPPVRTIVAMVRSGALTDAQATLAFKAQGLTAEMAQAQLDDAHHQKLAADKTLAKSDILQLYQDQVIDAEIATGLLGADGWTAEEIAWLLQTQDVKRAIRFVEGAISRIHTYYVSRKIDKTGAVTGLDALHVPPAQRDDLLQTWEVERTSNVKVLSPAEIANAAFYKIISVDQALALLEADGYDQVGAWILLSVRFHAPLDNPPAGVEVPPSGP